MLKKYHALMVATLLGVGIYASAAGSASAAAMLPLQPVVAGQSVDGGNALLQDVRMRQWDRRMDGNRCSYRNGNCRHFHQGYYYQTPWWIVPGIIGGAIIQNEMNNNHNNYGSRHVQWCFDHYRSYNPRYNTWVSNSGQLRQCNSPY